MAYFTKVTDTGATKISAALAAGNTIAISQLCVGDGNGADYEPVGTETALVNQVWAGSVSAMFSEGKILTVEAMIPYAAGGFTIREIGMKDSGGDLIAIGNYPATIKPSADDGGLVEILIRMQVKLSTDAVNVVSFTIDEGTVYATRDYVDQTTDTAVNNHSALTSPHSATSEATAERLVLRDASGRAAFSDGVASGDAVNVGQLAGHADSTTPHGATAEATASRIVLRDADGRARFAPGVASGDAVNVGQLGNHAELTSAHGSTPDAVAGRIVQRDSNGCAAFGPATDPFHAVILSQFQSDWAAGWFKIPGGLILQWGQALTTTENNWITHNFPIAFPTAALVIVGIGANGMVTLDPDVRIQIVSTSQFKIYNTGYENSPVNWLALGR